MTKLLAALVAALFAVASVSPAFAGDAPKDDGKAKAEKKKADKKKGDGKEAK